MSGSMNSIQAGCLIPGDSIFSCNQYHKISKIKARFDKGLIEFYSKSNRYEYLIRCCNPNEKVKAIVLKQGKEYCTNGI